MKLKIVSPILAILFLSILTSPVKNFAQSRLGIKMNFTEQETRELNKLKSSGVVARTTFAKLAVAGDVKPTKVEEMTLNSKGLPIEKKSLNIYGKINDRTEFKYDSKGNLIKKTVYNGDNVVTSMEAYKLDKSGKILEIDAQTLIRRQLHKTKRVLTYDKKGLLLETRGYENGKNFMVKEVCDYNDGLLIAKKSYNFAGQFLGSEVYEYDAQKRKIKESDINITYEQNKDSLSVNKSVQAIQDNAEYSFKYDEKGNLIEIKAPEYKQVFVYNAKGDFTRDTITDKGGKKQNDNEFIYGDDGLLKRIIRYYGDGSPGAYIDYVYEVKK